MNHRTEKAMRQICQLKWLTDDKISNFFLCYKGKTTLKDGRGLKAQKKIAYANPM